MPKLLKIGDPQSKESGSLRLDGFLFVLFARKSKMLAMLSRMDWSHTSLLFCFAWFQSRTIATLKDRLSLEHKGTILISHVYLSTNAATLGSTLYLEICGLILAPW